MSVVSNLRRAFVTQLVVVAAAYLGGCAGARRPPASPATSSTAPTAVPVQGVMLGIDVLEQQEFQVLRGKRIGLLTHPAAVNRFGASTLEVIHRDKRNNLVALFGIEHGIYGTIPAGEKYEDHVDQRTGLTVHSLYTGRTRWPTAEQLRGIDVLVIDLQDIGTRSYTFISAMRYAVEACFEQNTEVVVLDRPNPLGGLKVSGPMMDAEFVGYLGAFRVPYVHGLTMGELARMAATEPGVLRKVPTTGLVALAPLPDDLRRRGRLTVVPMRGWRRDMMWPQTGFSWIATSPNIPDFDAAVGYPMTGLGAQLGVIRHGIGTPYPFRFLTHPSMTPAALADELTRRRIPGLRFVPREVTIPPAAGARNATPRTLAGVYVEISDWNAWRPTELSLVMMQMSAANVPRADAAAFNNHAGSRALWTALQRDGTRLDVGATFAQWEREAAAFQQHSRQYWLYR